MDSSPTPRITDNWRKRPAAFRRAGPAMRRLVLPWLAVILLAGPTTVAAQRVDDDVTLNGVWEVAGTTRVYGQFRFFVSVEKKAGEFVATKLNASRYVPARREHFRGRVKQGLFQAKVQVALPAFEQPEWRDHIFALEGKDGGVTSMTLATGEVLTDDEGESSTVDTWTYTRWPGDRYRLRPPKLTDNAVRRQRQDLRRQIKKVERDIDHVEKRQADFFKRITALNKTYAGQSETEGRRKDSYEAAWRHYLAAADEQAKTELPPELWNLRTTRDTIAAGLTAAEDTLVSHANGEARLSPGELTAATAKADALKVQLANAERALAAGLRKAGRPDAVKPDEMEIARRRAERNAAFEAASDALLNAEKALTRTVNEMSRLSDLYFDESAELDPLQARRAELRDRLKGLHRPEHLVGIEAYAGDGGENGVLVYQAVPWGLDEDLAELRTILDEARADWREAEDIREQLSEEFEKGFDEITGLRDAIRVMIKRNAATMATTEASVKLAELVIAYGTGGPVGLAIDILTTPMMQYAFYDDGVVFENYDETALQAAYGEAKKKSIGGRIAVNNDCEFLKARLDQELSMALISNTRGTLGGSPPVGGAAGNSSRRLGGTDHLKAQVLAKTLRAAGTLAGKYLHYERALMKGGERLALLVEKRSKTNFGTLLGKKQREMIRRLSALDAELRGVYENYRPHGRTLSGRKNQIDRLIAEREALLNRLWKESRSPTGWVREFPESLAEQIALRTAQLGPGRAGHELLITADKIADAKYAGKRVEKWSYEVLLESGHRIEIHYMYDLVSGARTDFKFKNPPAAQTAALDDIVKLLGQLKNAEKLVDISSGADRAEALKLHQKLVRELGDVQTMSRIGLDQNARISWRWALKYRKWLNKAIIRELAKLKNVETLLAKAKSALKPSKGTIGAVIASLVMGVAKEVYYAELQEDERALWEQVFEKQIDQAFRFRTSMRASCIYWALSDHLAEIRKHYLTLWNAYDPEGDFEIKVDEPFRDYERLTVRLVHEPASEIALRVRVAEKPCRQDSAAGCALAPGALSGVPGPYLDFEIAVAPP